METEPNDFNHLNEFKFFYDVLRENLDSYRGEYERFVDYSPDLCKLLSDILSDKSLPGELRMKICAVLGYFVVPYDIIPEQIYGPYGYIDDVFLCCHIIKEIADVMGYEFLEREWEGDEELKDVVDVCYEESRKILGDKCADVLGYVGMG